MAKTLVSGALWFAAMGVAFTLVHNHEFILGSWLYGVIAGYCANNLARTIKERFAR